MRIISMSESVDDDRAGSSPASRSADANEPGEVLVVSAQNRESMTTATQHADFALLEPHPHHSSIMDQSYQLFNDNRVAAAMPDNVEMQSQLQRSALDNHSMADSGDHPSSLQLPQSKFPDVQMLNLEQPTVMPGVNHTALDFNRDEISWDVGFGLDSCSFNDNVNERIPLKR
jgi:hypothetical protein